ncbi:MAG: HAMP domain-containing histidine kinase [Microscillaceae bacterium]|jgi:two-component system phosphate regulon sensor histidine kinase PhoR|nr:HAMP domain-containing histidine kinase [Microscillaceae bacterium]
MKKKRIIYIIAISALALVGLVILQISWINQATELRQEQLKHRITMAGQRIYRKLSHDYTTLAALNKNLEHNEAKQLVLKLNSPEKSGIDSILKAEFRYHQINLPYTFKILDKTNKDFAPSCSYMTAENRIVFALCLEDLTTNHKSELRIELANPQQYVYAQMGWMLGGSVFFIGLVIACFGMTIYTIWQQKKMSEMTTDFINNMTHELKTPISTISLASNMLRKKQITENPEKIIHYSGIIHEENHKLQSQVEQVLRIAKLERGDFQLNKEEVNIHDVIQNAIQSIDLQVNTRGGQIYCYLNALHNTIKADVTHLTNVVANLLDNANKYSPENPQIVISTHDREDGVVISVEDKGIGMSKDKQKYIFEKFYRVSTGNVHDVKGFGLGLAYVKMMVDAHKGHIHLNSDLGKGSRFDIFLPYSA